MAVAARDRDDVETILAKRHDNGADFWATSGGRWGKGSPFSTFDCVLMLHELGVPRGDPVMKGAAGVLLDAQHEDGRFRPAPKATIHPCHTARRRARSSRSSWTARWSSRTRTAGSASSACAARASRARSRRSATGRS